MAKAAILDVLKTTIGKYVQNLDAESLNVAVWAGKIELNSLKLDVEAVNRELARQAAEAPNLAIPFRVVSGSFKHLCVDVPWARITSRPVVMRLEGLDAIVEPYDHLAAKYGRSANTSESKLYGLREEEQSASTEPKLYGYHDEEHSASTTTPSKKKKKKNKGDERMITVSLAEEGRQRAITMKQLADIETEGPLSGFEVDKSEQKRSSSKGFKARLVRRIIENLQVDIDGVKLEMRGKGCIAGILLDHFSIVTTDKYGNRNFVDRATNSCDVEKSFIYKVLQLQGLGIYCDEENNYSKQKAGSNNYMPLEINARGERNFILSPFSFEAKLRQSDCLKCIDFPKYHLSTKLPSVEIQLSRTQLEMVNKISRDLAAKQHVSRPLFPEYRPEEPLNGKNAKLWWKYALRAVGRITRKRSWTEFYIAFEKRKTYIPLYKRSVSRNCSWIIPLNEEEELMMKNIEMDKTIGVQGLMSWRSIAEGQIDLERKKYEAKEAVRNNAKSTPKKRFGLFGSKAYESSDDLGHLSDDDDDSPITLSISEMKDLEKIGREEHEVDNELTSDSILCDVNFHLGSFGIELTTFASRPLASFQMGTLSSSFKANNDGSFVSDFQMSSFNISDRITCNTLFPYVVRSLEHPKSSNQTDELQHAFGFKLTKAKNGDQSLDARLVSFEIIACDVFIKECKRFVTFSHEDFSSNTAKNPTLEFSVSGGADLFYDANDPMMTLNAPSINGSDIFDYRSHSNRSKVSDKVATAFNDAWKSKLERKIAWQIQLDVRAPVIVLPQTCVDPMATVLVADLGNFLFEYGGRKVEKDVRKWFESDGVEEDVSIDRCSLQLNDFTFLIGKAGNKDWLKSDATDLPSKIKSEAIIEPTNFGIDIGIENGGGQRICLFGVLPSISLKIAYSQIERILSVISFWSNLAKYISNSEDNLLISSASDEIDEEDQDEAVDNDIERNVNKDEELKKGGSGDKFLSFALQKLSLQITNDEDESIETHFISVETTYRQSSDGLTSVRMRMGCFWILDHLNSTFVREQRLFAHSTLPKSASFYAKNGYEILRDLEEEGVFEDSTKINSLADVTLTNAPCIANSLKDVSIIADHARNYPVTKIDAEFSTLLIHWNPYTVRSLLGFIEGITGFISNLQDRQGEAGNNQSPRLIANKYDSKDIKSVLIVNAQMEAFEIFLNSAKDDLPLFMMKMCDAKVKYHVSKDTEENQIAIVSLGDLRVSTPTETAILPEYSTILGLSSNFSSSLLELELGKGCQVIQKSTCECLDKEETEMYIDVSLSPMRFVHIQSQILILVEYITEGVLGSVTKKVASSAAQAAYELSHKETLGKSVFFIQARAIDFVVPQAAYSPNFFALNIGNSMVNFTSFPTPGEGEAVIALQEVTMQCNKEERIINNPIRMDINVSLAPIASPTLGDQALDDQALDNQATRVDVSSSRAQFLVTNQHYLQVMKTLETNIGESNSFFRDDHHMKGYDEEKNAFNKVPTTALTHGGAKEVIIIKRMYMTFKFEELVLELCRTTNTNVILSIQAVETNISIQLFPHDETMKVFITLNDLVAEDRRFVARNRHFRSLVRQVEDLNKSLDPDVFKLEYFQSKRDQVQQIAIFFGRPQLVFIPDLVSEVLLFFRKDDELPQSIQIGSDNGSSISLDNIKRLDDSFSVLDSNDLLVNTNTKTLKLDLETADCRFVLIDMGSSITNENNISSKKKNEVIILQGKTKGKMELVSDSFSGSLIKTSIEIHGDKFEVYTAEGENLQSPVQVVNPIQFSSFLSSNLQKNDQRIDITIVTLSTVHVMMSIQNYALFSAIASSTVEAWSLQKDIDASVSLTNKPLTDKVIEEIQKVSSDLEKADLETASNDPGVEMIFRDAGTATHLTTQSSLPYIKRRLISMKLTLPETAVTVINDLQGIDNALFKVTMQSCVFGGDVSLDETAKQNTKFHMYTNAQILADYFDSHTKLWEPLLLKRWEIDFKSARGRKKGQSRCMTSFDAESHPCEISFSEQLIISLRGALSMWSVYSATRTKALDILAQANKDRQHVSFVKAKASHAARAMTTTMPYGIENRTGFTIYFDIKQGKQEACDDRTTFFTFSLPKGDGVGGVRSYGQDSIAQKSIDLYIDGEIIQFDHLDDELKRQKKAHTLKNDRLVFTEVVSTGKTTLIRLFSFMTILNETSLNYSVALSHGDKSELIGSIGCKSVSQVLLQSAQNKLLGVPISALERVYFNHKSSEDNIAVQFLHGENEKQVLGEIQLPPFQTFYKMSNSKSPMRTFEMVCSSIMERKEVNSKNSRMIIKVGCKVTLVDGFPFVELFLQPRLMLQNNMCINIFAKTLMPRIYKNGVSDDCSSNDDAVIYRLEPYESLEIFTPGKSVLFSFRCADAPVGDVKTGWNQPGWIELPITETLEDRIDCYFPFVTKSDEDSNFGDGSTFFIIEEHGVSEVSIPLNPQSPQLRVITVNLENLGIDHTGDFLFESFKNNSHSFTLCSFSSTFKMRRITMLPSNKKPIRLFQLSTNKRSKPLCIEDVAFADGGLDSTSIIWTDDSESGFYVYKKLSFHNEFENYPNSQMEVHIIPAIIIYNGGDHHVQVIHSGSHKSELAKGKMTPVHQSWEENGIRISILFDSLDCISSQVTISKTGVLVSVVKSLVTGTPVGSIAFQTMIGRSDSRHVIKIGPLIHGNVAGVDSAEAPKTSLFENDILRFRARWSHMKVTFLDTSKDHRDNLNDLKLEISESSPTLSSKKVTSYAKVANVVLSRFTVDYQRVFKDDVVSATLKKRTQRRSQFAVVVHNIHLKDFTENVTGTTVLASISKKTSFFDLCIRTRDKGIAGMSSIDLLELKLANDGKVSDKIILNTTEAFVWRLLDIASRTKNASETFSAVDSNIKWNPQLQIFEVEVIDGTSGNTTNEYGNYEVPRNISIYHVKRASVLPTSFILSFKRQPQASRYQNVQNIKGAKIVDYFSKKLNFTVDKAHLRFSGFNITNVKGPLDKIIDQLKAFYSHQMKSKIFALLTSTSIDEWQQLAGRDEGDRGFVEGDILRTAGNLTGKSAGFIVKKVGQGINVGLTAATAEVGDGIQQMSEAIGVGAVGAGVNSVLNGIGGGVGSTVQGVGDGGSKIIKGAGKGVGQIVGGFGGGIMLTAKGIGKGVTEGDGNAILAGLGDGAMSIGNGLMKGSESVVTGVGDGVFAVGKGLFSGVKNIGAGLGSAVTGRPVKLKDSSGKGRQKRRPTSKPNR